MMRDRQGQALAEFALILPVFFMMVLGLFDAVRLGYYYNAVQEAAHVGARWAAVEVTRDGNSTTNQGIWGDFADPGNAPGRYCQTGCDYTIGSNTITVTGSLTPTIVGSIAKSMVLSNRDLLTVDISTTIPSSAEEITQTNSLVTDQPITVSVSYPFKPILSFGLLPITLTGKVTSLHE